VADKCSIFIVLLFYTDKTINLLDRLQLAV